MFKAISASSLWAVVINGGTDKQEIWELYDTHKAAATVARELKEDGENADVMKQLPDGTLTTEF